MAFGVTMVFLIIAYYSYKYIFEPLSRRLAHEARLPEYRRDKDKPLAPGQIWTDGSGRFFRINKLHTDTIEYTLVLSDKYRRDNNQLSLPWHYKYHNPIEHFIEIRDEQRLHLTEKIEYF